MKSEWVSALRDLYMCVYKQVLQDITVELEDGLSSEGVLHAGTAPGFLSRPAPGSSFLLLLRERQEMMAQALDEPSRVPGYGVRPGPSGWCGRLGHELATQTCICLSVSLK